MDLDEKYARIVYNYKELKICIENVLLMIDFENNNKKKNQTILENRWNV